MISPVSLRSSGRRRRNEDCNSLSHLNRADWVSDESSTPEDSPFKDSSDDSSSVVRSASKDANVPTKSPREGAELPRTGTLVCCWGALKEAVDALGAFWDGCEDDSMDNKVISIHRVDAFSSELPRTPVRRPGETAASRPRLDSFTPRPSYFDSLRSPPTTRPSRWKRKYMGRTTLPVAMQPPPKLAIDPLYSTTDEEEEGKGVGGAHSRLLGEIFYQGPPRCSQDEVQVFSYRDEGRGSHENSESASANKAQENNRHGHWRRSARFDAISKYALDWSPITPSREGNPNGKHWDRRHVRPDELMGALRTVVFGETDLLVPRVLQQRTRRVMATYISRKYDAFSGKEVPPFWTTTPTPNIESRPDFDQANPIRNDCLLMRRFDASKDIAQRRRKQDLTDWIIETLPGRGIDEDALPSIPQHAQSQTEHGMPSSERSYLMMAGAPRRHVRRPASCVILSARMPPERDLTDLLTTPWMTFYPKGLHEREAADLAISRSNDKLMSDFGVVCHICTTASTNDRNASAFLADNIMAQSAGMGSMLGLGRRDDYVSGAQSPIKLERCDTSNVQNQHWHALDDARISHPGWNSLFEVTELPTEFQIGPFAPAKKRSKDVTGFEYNWQCTYQELTRLQIVHEMQKSSYAHKWVHDARHLWSMWNRRYLHNYQQLPRPDPVACTEEAYTLSTVTDWFFEPTNRRSSFVNEMVLYMNYADNSPKMTYSMRRDMARHGLRNFEQLAGARFGCLAVQIYTRDHPEGNHVFNPPQMWQEVGYDFISPLPSFYKPPVPRSQAMPGKEGAQPQSPPKLSPPASTQHMEDVAMESSQPLEQQAPTYPQPQRRKPRYLSPRLPPSRPDVYPPMPSLLTDAVYKRQDEGLSKMYERFVDFQRTGEQPPPLNNDPKPTTYRSVRYPSYRPVMQSAVLPSPSSNVYPMGNAGTGRILRENRSPAALKERRLGSSELFPDIYPKDQSSAISINASLKPRDSVAQQPQKATSSASLKPRDSVAEQSEQPTTAARDFALHKATTFVPQEDSVSRRNANRSESDRSSVSSTDSSRARRLLEDVRNNDKAAQSTSKDNKNSATNLYSASAAVGRWFVSLASPSKRSPTANDDSTDSKEDNAEREGAMGAHSNAPQTQTQGPESSASDSEFHMHNS